jgi:hypothetical protein
MPILFLPLPPLPPLPLPPPPLPPLLPLLPLPWLLGTGEECAEEAAMEP